MSPAAKLCGRVVEAGLTIRVDGTDLVLTPTERLQPDLRASLIEHKPEVIVHLRKVELQALQALTRIRRKAPLPNTHRKDAA